MRSPTRTQHRQRQCPLHSSKSSSIFSVCTALSVLYSRHNFPLFIRPGMEHQPWYGRMFPPVITLSYCHVLSRFCWIVILTCAFCVHFCRWPVSLQEGRSATQPQAQRLCDQAPIRRLKGQQISQRLLSVRAGFRRGNPRDRWRLLHSQCSHRAVSLAPRCGAGSRGPGQKPCKESVPEENRERAAVSMQERAVASMVECVAA